MKCTSLYNCNVPYTGPTAIDFQYARTGNNMMAVWSYDSITSYYYQRDYLHGHLINILHNGKQYCITYYVNLQNSSGVAIKYFGMYLDNGLLDTLMPCTNFSVTPQIDNTGGLLSDTLKWMKIEGVYTANGTETNITLGNFKSDSNSGKTLLHSSNPYNPFGTYYFLDDISIIPMDLPAYAGNDTSIVLNDSTYIGRASEVGLDDDCIWYVLGNSNAIDTVAGMWVKPSTTISYVLEQNICGTISYDTVVVAVNISGIKQFRANGNQLSVYPNPTSNILQVTFTANSQTTQFQISDVLGNEMIKDNKIKNGTTQIDVSNLMNGVYFIRVANCAQKFVVQHE